MTWATPITAMFVQIPENAQLVSGSRQWLTICWDQSNKPLPDSPVVRAFQTSQAEPVRPKQKFLAVRECGGGGSSGKASFF